MRKKHGLDEVAVPGVIDDYILKVREASELKVEKISVQARDLKVRGHPALLAACRPELLIRAAARGLCG